ncbi:MAG TPA: damage-inducible protein [Thermomonospora sp.]|nr:damage-inducible protein [Thermomonospora sp.]
MEAPDGLPFPPTDIALRAMRYVREIQDPAIFHHSMRAYLYGRFLTGLGYPEEKVEVVWDAVALHLCYEIALRKRPEIALVTAGAGYDLSPFGPPLPAGYAERIHSALPRLHASAVLYDAIVGQALDKPHKAPPFSPPGELLRQRTREAWPTWKQLMTQQPSWNDYDGYPPEGSL